MLDWMQQKGKGEEMIDRLMKKLGYEKIEEDESGVYYIKKEKQNYDHVVCLLRKNGGEHIMKSYDRKMYKIMEGKYINEAVGVDVSILLLMWMKAKWMSMRYGWPKECRVKGDNG